MLFFQDFIVDGSNLTPITNVSVNITSANQADHIRYLNMELRNNPCGLLVEVTVSASFIEFIGENIMGLMTLPA